MKRSTRKWLFTGMLVVVVAGAFLTYTLYSWIEGNNVKISEPTYLYIPTGSTFDELVQLLSQQDILEDQASFFQVASWMKFSDAKVKSGKYLLHPGLSNRSLINMLRAGRQSPVRMTINNIRTLPELAGKITADLELDSATYLNYLLSPDLSAQVGKDTHQLLTHFLPNTYEVYWNTTAASLTDRMIGEHQKFWNQDDRKDKAERWQLSPEEVYTLASIVEKETQASTERPIVAGLYLNRLQRNIPLQADPTIVFAVGEFGLRRVLNKHLEVDSPYNTYKFTGLPPGPICMPSINSIDAVLNAEEHNYLYMCARPDFSGLHAFASTLSEHNRNANRYRRWLDQEGIR